MAILFDGLQLSDISGVGLPISPAAGEVAFDGAFKFYDGVQWTTFSSVGPGGESSTITMASGAVIEGDDGTVGAPAFTFKTDDEYGMYFDGVDTIGLAGGGADILQLTASGTPVNYWEMLSSDAASPVQLKALGTDTNVGMELDPKGTGTITVADAATYDANVGATSLVTKNYVDTAIGAGASGADKQIQFNDGGSNFGADADFTWDKTTHELTVGSSGVPGTVKGPDGSTSAGVAISLTGGAANGQFDGGAVNITGGASDVADSGDGGAVVVTGGASSGPNGLGGDVELTPGAGSGSGVEGAVRLGGVLTWTTSPYARQIRAGAATDADVGAGIDVYAQDNAAGAGGGLTLDAGDGGGNGAGGGTFLRAGRGSGTGDGGATTVSAGDGGLTGDGGDLDLSSGVGGSTSGSGGDLNITAGGRQAGAGNGGNVNITAGDGSATGGAAGAVFVRPGYGGAAPTLPTVSGIPQPAEFWFVDGNNTTPGYVGFKAPADVASAGTGDGANTVWALPEGEGWPNQVMTTDGAGILSWSATIQGDAGQGAAGGDASLLGGDSDTDTGGNANVTGGNVTGPGSGDGGAVFIDGGAGASTGGNEAASVAGGDVQITGGIGATDGGAGANTDTSGGNVVITGGPGGGTTGAFPASGGNVRLEGGLGAGSGGGADLGGSIELIPGGTTGAATSVGAVEIHAAGSGGVATPAMIIADTGAPGVNPIYAAGPPGGVPALYFDISMPPSSSWVYVWDASPGPGPAWRAL